jgi:hypothetical protein
MTTAEVVNLLNTTSVNNVDIISTLFNFFICVIMAFVLKWFYVNKSFALTGKNHIGSIIPILALVVFVVIVIVKSSLALSLGLVGALSIVRFRTPIKEPEELVYLFLAIVLGLGYGSGQTLITSILFTLILVIIYIWLSNKKFTTMNEYNLIVNFKQDNINYETILEIISAKTESIKLVRLEQSNSQNTAIFQIVPNSEIDISSLNNILMEKDKEIKVTFFEIKSNW